MILNLCTFCLRRNPAPFLQSFSRGQSGSTQNPFKPKTKFIDFSKPLVISKYTRLEFERTRWEVSEDTLKEILKTQGSNYNNLQRKHNQHYWVLQRVQQALHELGCEAKTVQRENYDEELISQSSVIISVGGDGTFLQAASKISSTDKPLIGVNSDPDKSLGYLCLPSASTRNVPKAFRKLMEGDFRWFHRKRIRLTVDSNGRAPSGLSLWNEQMKFYDHLSDLRQSFKRDMKSDKLVNKTVLPMRALNEVFIGEYVASGTSYFEMKINKTGPLTKHKSSGLIVSTGTGSHAWYLSHRKLSTEQIKRLLQITSRHCSSPNLITDLLNEENLNKIGDEYLNEVVHFDPCSNVMMFSVKDPLHNRVFRGSSANEQGIADEIRVHSRMWDGCVILDGNWVYGFEQGAWIKLEVLDEDSLTTVQLD